MAPIVRTETQHMGEFLVSTAMGDRSREEGTLAAGQTLEDGTLLSGPPTALVAWESELNTEDAIADDITGILLGSHDTSTEGEGEAKQVAYIARDAEVVDVLIHYPAGGASAAQVKTALAALGIIVRESV